MSASRSRFRPGEYVLLWFFLAAALIGLAGTTSLAWSAATAARHAAVAPTTEEYRASATAVMAPFLAQAKSMVPGDFGDIDAATFRVVVDDVQAKLLALRVPGDHRDAHLSFVLLLDRWKRAFDGGETVRETAVLQLQDALVAYPWIDAPAVQPL